jgi:hypothetical protein
MKGQHHILNEILIFAFGIAIASFVVISFGGMSNSIEKVSLEDQFGSIAGIIRNGIVKAHYTNSTVRIMIPEKISNNNYKIILSGNEMTIISLDGSINITKQLFNMDKSYNINGEVVSSASYVKITRRGNIIELSRIAGE